MSLNYAFLLDVLIAILLVATIAYAFVLDRRLAKLRANKGELEEFVARLNAATQKAEESTRGMRQTAENCQRMMNDPVNKAQALRDELQFLIERADQTGERLANASSRNLAEEGSAGAAKTQAKRPAAKPASAKSKSATQNSDTSAPRSKAEQDLMRALKDAK